MRVYISADIEGVAGVAGFEQTQKTGFEFTLARQWMTREVIAAAEAAHDAGAEEVVVADGHGTAQNILLDELPDYVRLIRSWPRPLLQMQGIEDGHYDAALYVGHHAGMTSAHGVHAHTYHGGCIRDIRLSGDSQSETSLNTLLAAHYQVPVLFSSGDSDYIEHVNTMNPTIETVVTKKAYGYGSVNTHSVKVTSDMIRTGVSKAFARRKEISQLDLPENYVLEIEFQGRSQAEMWDYLPWVSRTGTFCSTAEFENMEQVMKFITFVILYQAAGAPGF